MRLGKHSDPTRNGDHRQETPYEMTPCNDAGRGDYTDALGHIYTNLLDLPTWFRRLTPGQLEDIARLMANWRNPAARADCGRPEQISIPNLADVERDAVRRAIQLCDGNVLRAAKALNIGKTTIYRKLRIWGENSKLVSQAAALGATQPNSSSWEHTHVRVESLVTKY